MRSLQLQRHDAQQQSGAALAELQQRLQLPPELMESWIGRVRFGQGPCGPVLPSTPRRP
jgi:hypothetical protein